MHFILLSDHSVSFTHKKFLISNELMISTNGWAEVAVSNSAEMKFPFLPSLTADLLFQSLHAVTNSSACQQFDPLIPHLKHNIKITLEVSMLHSDATFYETQTNHPMFLQDEAWVQLACEEWFTIPLLRLRVFLTSFDLVQCSNCFHSVILLPVYSFSIACLTSISLLDFSKKSSLHPWHAMLL